MVLTGSSEHRFGFGRLTKVNPMIKIAIQYTGGGPHMYLLK